MLRFSHVGIVSMMHSIRTRKDVTREQLGDAIVAVLEEEKREVIEETPRMTGALRSTIRVVGPEFNGSMIRAHIAAGSDEVDYALIVHEDPDAFHPIGDWKYIERPLMESAGHFLPRVAAKLV